MLYFIYIYIYIYSKGYFRIESSSDVTKIYLNTAKTKENSKEFTSRKNHQERILRKKNVPLSYTRARELFLDVVAAVGKEKANFP